MLALRLGDTFLDLAPSTVLNLSFIDPIFDKQRIARTFSFPFKLPLSPKNKKALGFAYRLDASSRSLKYEASLLFASQIIEQGILRILSVKETYIEVAFQNQSLDLLEKMKSIKLRELAMPVSVNSYTPNVTLLFNDATEVGETRLMVVEVNGILFEQDTNLAGNLINLINAEFPSMVSLAPIPAQFHLVFNTLAYPDLKIKLFPSPVSPADQYYFGSVIIPDTITELAHAQIWKNHLADVLASPTTHVFPTMRMPDLYDENNEDYIGLVNVTDENSGEYELNELVVFGTNRWPHTLIAMPFLHAILQQSFLALSIDTLIGDLVEDSELRKLILYSNRTLDHNISPENFIIDQENITDPLTWNGFPESYNLASQLPDLTLYEFILAIQSLIPFLIQVEGGKVRLDTIQSYLNQQAEDFTARIEPSYDLEIPEYDSFSLDYDRQEEAVLEAEQLLKIAAAIGVENTLEITSSYFSLYTRRTTFSSRGFSIPITKDKGYSALAGIDEDTPLKMLIYHGLQPDSAGNTYPFASHSNTNHVFQQVANLSLDFQGQHGLYENYWKDYIKLLVNGETITLNMRLSLADILSIKARPAKKIYCYHPKGAFQAIIKKVQVKFSLQSIGIASVQIVKL